MTTQNQHDAASAPDRRDEGHRAAYALIIAAMRRDFEATAVLLAELDPDLYLTVVQYAVAAAAHASLANANLAGVPAERVISNLRERSTAGGHDGQLVSRYL
jgi:hypothetical protein